MRKVICLLLIASLFGCKTTKEGIIDATIEDRLLDTLTVSAPRNTETTDYTLPVFNGSATKEVDLVHTSLDLSFNWDKQHVLGNAKIVLKPYFYDMDKIELDAIGFDIHKVSKFGKDLKFDYDGKKLIVDLGKMHSRDNLLEIEIDYTAKPNETPAGSSSAITSEKGLFFINPLNKEADKPQQIWTQGETENNSRWFPTVDKPNQRCSQEIKLTVEDRFATLSNGKLLSSKKNTDGTRTDHWKQEKPHAPYLFMIGIGEFAVIKDSWNGKDLMYYVEPEYEADAKKIFNHTAEMLQFFSDKLDYPYPWDKYAQLIAQDFVSGAMENTGAVIFGDFCQKTSKQLVDSDNDYIVAHEMFHHWFGDLVTCESWANLTMNEGFANYSEYLWFEHKYGKNRADHHRQNELGGYLGSLQRGGAHPLIHYGYDDKEQMFDAHSYNKGGLVLHMLRSIVGDDAFYTSLHKYLKDNEYSEVEADELRLAFEDVTGKDLIWFFDQWYFSSGHPQLNVEYNFDKAQRLLNISVEQTQDAEDYPKVFILPTTIAVYDVNGKVTYQDIVINQREQSFTIPFDGNYAFASIDGHDNLLAEISENKTPDQYAYQLLHSDNYREQILALDFVKDLASANEIYEKAIKNNYHNIRRKAISLLGSDEKNRSMMETLAVKDPHSNVRTAAINYLSELESAPANSDLVVNSMKNIIKKDESYRPANAALKYISKLNPAEGIKLTEELSKDPYKSFSSTITSIYMESGDDKYIPKLLQNLDEAREVNLYFTSQSMLPFLKEKDNDTKLKAAKIYLEQTKRGGPPFIKFVCTGAINELKSSLSEDASDELKADFDKIIGDLPK